MQHENQPCYIVNISKYRIGETVCDSAMFAHQHFYDSHCTRCTGNKIIREAAKNEQPCKMANEK